MSLKNKKVGIFVENLYEDLELWVPYYRLIEEEATVELLGTGKKEYKSKHGYPAVEDRPVEQANVGEYDAVIIPGGYSPDHMRRHRPMVEFLKEANNQKKVIAAICHGGWMLVSAGIIEGKIVTGFFSIKDDLMNAKAQYVDEEVFRDGNIITSRQPSDLPAFCREIINALKK